MAIYNGGLSVKQVTKTSELTNDSGFLTSLPDHSHNYADSASAGGSATSSLSLINNGTLDTQDKIDGFLEGNKLKYATFKTSEQNNVGFASNDGMIISIPWGSAKYGAQIAFDDTTSGLVKIRGKADDTWGEWKQLWKSGDSITAPTITATNGFNGNVNGSSTSCTGNAASATKATQDGLENVITDTYATKTELSNYIPNFGSSMSFGNGAAISIPTMNANTVYSWKKSSGSRDTNIMYSSEDGMFVANSGDCGYVFAVYNTDVTTDGNFADASAPIFKVNDTGGNSYCVARYGFTAPVITATDGFNGNLNGNASSSNSCSGNSATATLASQSNQIKTTSATNDRAYYLSFTDAAATYNNLYTNTDIICNPGTGTLKAPRVEGAVCNDLADSIPVDDNCNLEHGYCYCFDGEKYYKSSKYLDNGIIGIHSDTFGFRMGAEEDKKKMDVAVSGFVLAYVDKEYPVGTPLTCTENGYLTEIELEDKMKYPEKIVATYWKNEPNEEWGLDNKKVKVNGRKWVKIK